MHLVRVMITFLIFLDLCVLRNKPLLILGDFNDDLFLPSNKMNQIIKTLHLNQLVEKPTRITATSSTLLDLVITDRQHFAVQSDVLNCSVGDHELLTATINIRKENALQRLGHFDLWKIILRIIFVVYC